MNDFKTIATFTYPSELAVAKSKLASEGVEFRTLDELSVQAHNFLSNAIGGIKLQVREKNIHKARKILIDGGFIKDEMVELSGLEKKLNDIGFQKKLKTGFYILMGVIALAIIIAVSIKTYHAPNDFQKLVGRNWCLDQMVYKGEVYYPNTLHDEIQFKGIDECEEKIQFHADGSATIPGFTTRLINAKWSLKDDLIEIYSDDTLATIFKEKYSYTMNKEMLILAADSITLFCYNELYH